MGCVRSIAVGQWCDGGRCSHPPSVGLATGLSPSRSIRRDRSDQYAGVAVEDVDAEERSSGQAGERPPGFTDRRSAGVTATDDRGLPDHDILDDIAKRSGLDGSGVGSGHLGLHRHVSGRLSLSHTPRGYYGKGHRSTLGAPSPWAHVVAGSRAGPDQRSAMHAPRHPRRILPLHTIAERIGRDRPPAPPKPAEPPRQAFDPRNVVEPTPELIHERVRRTALVPAIVSVPCVEHDAAIGEHCFRAARGVCASRIIARAAQR